MFLLENLLNQRKNKQLLYGILVRKKIKLNSFFKKTNTLLYFDLFLLAGEEDDELPFKKGDVITILSKDEEWWQGELNGKTGSIPCNYVKLN